MLVFALKELDKNALAREVFDEQMEMGWPGLGLEAEEICRTIGIPNICTENVGKAEVKEAIMYHHMKEMKEEIKNKNYQKICNLVNEDLRKGQPYMKEKSLEFCRMAFRLRTHQFNCRGNLHGKYREGDRWCRSCSSSEEAGPGGDQAPEETQEHLEMCVAYQQFRVGMDVELNFHHKVSYFMKIEVERMKRGWM